jgi:hypothetical protein
MRSLKKWLVSGLVVSSCLAGLAILPTSADAATYRRTVHVVAKPVVGTPIVHKRAVVRRTTTVNRVYPVARRTTVVNRAHPVARRATIHNVRVNR